MNPKHDEPTVAILGGGPAGLMAADILAQADHPVDLYEAKPSLARKFLLAGRGGLNITHAEDESRFASRYGDVHPTLMRWVREFGATQVRTWCSELGIETFVGSSGKVFPKSMKASPLLRAWLRRLGDRGVRVHTRHRFRGWTEDGALLFETPDGSTSVRPRVTVMALGGGSWSRMGSDGSWVGALRDKGIDVADLKSTNCGFDVAHRGRPCDATEKSRGWTETFTERFAGTPLKSIGMRWTCPSTGDVRHSRGELMISRSGLEGSLIYAASRNLRDGLLASPTVTVTLDLLPDRDLEEVQKSLSSSRGSKSLSSYLKSRLRLSDVKRGLLYERLTKEELANPQTLAQHLKALSLEFVEPRPLEEAISTAGGVRFEGLDEHLMARDQPGLFFAGEMLDWEAPTGGYLLTACLATGLGAGRGAVRFLETGSDRH